MNQNMLYENQNIDFNNLTLNNFIYKNKQEGQIYNKNQLTNLSTNLNENSKPLSPNLITPNSKFNEKTKNIIYQDLDPSNPNNVTFSNNNFLNNKENNKNINCNVEEIYLDSLNKNNKISKCGGKIIQTIILKSLIKKKKIIDENREIKNDETENDLKKLINSISLNENELKNFPFEYTDEIITDLCSKLKENNIINTNKIQNKQNHLFLKNNFFQLRIYYFNFLIKLFSLVDLSESTLFLTFDIFDKYISCESIKEEEFLLILVTCYSIAVKYNERTVLGLDSLVRTCNYNFTKEEILHYEKNIMEILNFDISTPTIYDLFQFIKIAKKMNNILYNLGLLFLEMFITVGGNLKYSSLIILEAVYLLLLHVGNKKDSSLDLYKYVTGCDVNVEKYKDEVQKCLNDLKNECYKVKNGGMNELIIKFASNKYSNISQEFKLL